MQTLVFARALDSAIEELRIAELAELLSTYFAPEGPLHVSAADKNKFAELAFELRGGFARLHADSAEVVADLGLESLLSPSSLGRLITVFHNASQRQNILSEPEFWRLYYASNSTLRLRYAVEKELVAPKFDRVPEGRSILALEIIDYDERGVSVARLQNALGSLGALYSSVDQLLGRSHSGARVATWTPVAISRLALRE
jgi:hypothetical protein